MATVIENSTQHLRKEDLNAIARYLKSLPPCEGKASCKPVTLPTAVLISTDVLTSPFERPGAGLYSGFCAECHQDGTTGKSPKILALAGSAIILSANALSLIRPTLEDGKGPVTKNGPEPKEMPSYAKKFTDREIADVLTFIRNSWSNKAPAVTPRDVSSVRKMLEK